MSITDNIIKTSEDLNKLKEFVKLPENKLWLGQATAFFNKLTSGPQIATLSQLDSTSHQLLEIAERAVKLAASAEQGADFDDKDIVNRFCGALQTQHRKALTPEMRAVMDKGAH